MHSESYARLPRALVLGAGVLALATLTPSAQLQPRLVVSTTSNVAAGASPIGEIDDGALTAVGNGAPARPVAASGHWLALAGFVPGDVDAFGRRPGEAPGSARSLAFSLLSNEAGFLDGDILAIEPGLGAVVLISETELATALGLPDANLDVDALSFDDQGRLLFSLQADLTATALGTVEDGDVLRLEPAGNATLVLTEPEVQGRFTAATGLADAIGDVQGLEWFGGELWVAVQSPSSHDGGVLRTMGTPEVVIEEDQVGLGGAELNALSFAGPGDEPSAFTVSVDAALPGELVHVEAYGRPNELFLVLLAGGAGYVDFPGHTGIGGFYLDPLDPLLAMVLAAPMRYVAVMDGAGRYAADWSLPPGASGPGFGGEGWTAQVLALPLLEPTAPWRIQRL